MNINEEWDIEQHKAEHESDEHWELRRKFLLMHKDKFPEDQLVCLAQVFTNVELLGCRYPTETMELVSELAQDVVKEYREKHKNKLQRTFVKASDAASSKVKGFNASSSTNFRKSKISTNRSNFSQSKGIHSKKIKLDEGPFGNIVIIERPNDMPQSILAAAVNVSGGNLEWKFDKNSSPCKCTVLINSKRVSEACGESLKQVKKEASITALEELQKYYYTVKVKYSSRETNVTTTTIPHNYSTQDSISDDNIGKKLMKLMGWAGGGLGKSQQGITEPVVLNQQISREGLGLKANNENVTNLKLKCKDLLKDFVVNDTKDDLVFSADFTNEERAMIHQLARQFGLKSHSHGPKNKRVLVVSHKVSIQDLITELKMLGGVNDKYELIQPNKG